MDAHSSRRLYELQRPAYPHLAGPTSPSSPSSISSSTSSSAFQSSSSLASVGSLDFQGATSPQSSMHAHLAGQAFARGPMPSPSTESNANSYFASAASPPISQTLAGRQFFNHQPTNQSLPHHPHHQHHHHHQQQPYQSSQPRFMHPSQAPEQQSFVGQRGDGSGAPVTAPFLQDFSLIAEAAKRAQMDVLARDLDDIGL